jgi:ABC-type molybdate transport system substrate-binding protein
MKNFIKWLIPWDNEMKWLLKALLISIVLMCIFIVTGCSEFEKEMLIKKQYMEEYPFTTCDKNESLLICDSASLDECWGYLKNEPIIKTEEI